MNFEALEEQIEHASGEENKFFKTYWSIISNRYGQYCILAFWISMMMSGAFYGSELLDLTNFVFDAPSGTPGYDADKKLEDNFPIRAESAQLLLYFHCEMCSGNETILTYNDTFYNISMAMNKSLYSYKPNDDIVKSYEDYYTTIINYPDDEIFEAAVEGAYLNENQQSSIAVIAYDSSLDSAEKEDLINHIDDEIDDLNKLYKKIILTELTGQAALLLDMNRESHEDVEKKDMLTIPLALSVLAVIVKSWRMMFIPILCVFASLATSFTIMTPVATSLMEVNPFSPSIMMSVTIAMSIDYSLFLLTRFREEMEKKHGHVTVEHSVKQMARWSGKVVCLSGFILSITYFGLVFYPMSMLQSVGLGAAIAIICTIIVNLTFTPALILLFPNFFSQFGCTCKCKKFEGDTYEIMEENNPEKKRRSSNSDSGDGRKQGAQNIKEYEHIDDTKDLKTGSINNNTTIQAVSSGNTKNDHSPSLNSINGDVPAGHVAYDFNILPESERDDKCNRCWFTIGWFTSTFPYNIIIIIVVYALISPIGWRIFELKKQLDDTLIFPRDSDYLKTYDDVENEFSGGLLAPFYIQIPIADSQTTVYSESYFDDTSQMINYMNTKLNDEDIGVSITGISFFDSTPVNYANYTLLTKSKAGDTYTYFTASYVNSPDNTSSYFTMISDFDPYNSDAPDTISKIRDVLDDICSKDSKHVNITTDYDCYLSGGSVDEVDCVNTIFDSFAWVLAIIIGVVFGIMGVFFYAAFVPVRLFLTITIPMSLVYGLSILVYQKGLLSGLDADPVANTDGLYWIIPVMTVTILCGLALDYDVFLFARIHEYRLAGLSTHQSIVFGVYKTGSIITAAGCIMAIAFCGLLFSQITSLNQTGFILVVAVLVDTFVIRTLLVPAILSLVDEVNWWPGIDPHCKWYKDRKRLEEDNHLAVKMAESKRPKDDGDAEENNNVNSNIKSPLL